MTTAATTNRGMAVRYGTLGVPRGVSAGALCKAHHRLSGAHPPDKQPAARRAAAESRFVAIATAYKMLSSPHWRAAYDADLAAAAAAAAASAAAAAAVAAAAAAAAAGECRTTPHPTPTRRPPPRLPRRPSSPRTWWLCCPVGSTRSLPSAPAGMASACPWACRSPTRSAALPAASGCRRGWCGRSRRRRWLCRAPPRGCAGGSSPSGGAAGQATSSSSK
ncbi:hypothetical protein I4F81_007993 [Pyropia yezoensis]|uniref:Uncharacterized protein n=1 Tax=Pyropia yezoensis TaxID=2788 RepID=A0ACC3C5L3_PYRYE|nr:hypothetical protein I4F81_007993 [Neopyropia yezoensis]